VSGFSVTPAGPAGHAAAPLQGSWTTERGGGPADLLRSEDYPIAATCQECGAPIRLDHKLQANWRHAPAPAPPAGGAA
jgi:hypothetical protein